VLPLLYLQWFQPHCMNALVIAILFTLGVSAVCSLLEAMILSTTPSDIESLKKHRPKTGEKLERFRFELEETTSAILGLNTIANTLGATLVGGLAAQLFGDHRLIYFSIGMTVGILIFSEVIPKNVGVLYRAGLQPYLVPLLGWVRTLMVPVSFLCKIAVFLVIPSRPKQDVLGEDILLLAEKSEKDGHLTQDERTIISNTLSLDDTRIEDIMTPRTVVLALDRDSTVKEVFEEYHDLPFARIPVYEDQIDAIIGIVRRRDLLKAKANDEDHRKVSEFISDPVFVLGTRTAADALQVFLKMHQQLAVVLDEYGSMEGVVSMEDVIEHILGQEIFEKDDVAIDMREYAKLQNQKKQLEFKR
jgi:CBS domain containing-hemolysin-like protein